ncbi:hypothetical protein C8A01DRAFT_18901 [Parachaetomium inaequale]|uniref:Uncharacterized protein n=1 Tax=Parachaetomium inaequale TaxID=2588326 RepID=A0AAN6SP04_9PEZI|nr:hypothetical protein C8A01DRAFT_18901 [Parachaetomium inaequale]
MPAGQGSKSKAAATGPTYIDLGNGYYRLQGGDAEQLYYRGSDGQYHEVIRIRVAAGAVMPQADRDALTAYLMARNNTIQNGQGQAVRITSVTVTESLHKSKSTDKNTTDHYSVQLSNTALQAADGSSHLLHFRPADGNDQHLYPTAMTRSQITALQSKRQAARHRKPADKKDNNKKPPPSGGAGASAATKKVVVKKK